MQKIIVLVLLSLFLLGCTQTQNSFSLNQPFEIKEGAIFTYQDLSLEVISFTDSRCPSGVVCIWQGELGVSLRVNDKNIFLGELTNKTTIIDFKGDALNITLLSITQNSALLNVTITPREQIACTMDAKICPDGSGVGREPPLCNFKKCPNEQ